MVAFDINENREMYFKYFQQLLSKYGTKLLVYIIGFIIEILIIVIYKNAVVKMIAIPICIAFAIQIIVHTVKYFDVSSLFYNGFPYKHTDIEVKRITKTQINGVYCSIYINSIGIEVVKGKKYQATYLIKTLGKYLVHIEEFRED